MGIKNKWKLKMELQQADICYWKKICNTESREGIAFMRRFGVDYERCRTRCDGSNKCGLYLTLDQANEGELARLLK